MQIPGRSTAGAFLVKEGRLLLERRPDDAEVYPGLWDTPGGHVENGETPETAMIREMDEELAILPVRFILGMVQDDHDPVSNIFYRHFVYVVKEWEGESVSREGRHIRWFRFDDIFGLEPLNPLVRFALRSFMDWGWLED